MRKVRTKKAVVVVEIDGDKFEVEQITGAEVNKAQQKHTIDGVTDMDAMGKELFAKRVISWDGDLTDEDDKPLLCTKENKDFIWAYDNEYAGRIMGKANKAIADREDLEIKN